MSATVTFIGGPANLSQWAMPSLYEGKVLYVPQLSDGWATSTARSTDTPVMIASYEVRRVPGTEVWVALYLRTAPS